MPGDRPTPGTVRVGLEHSRAFESVSPELVDSIVRAARSVPVETGETIVREGEPGNSMFVIAQGQVRVTVMIGATRTLLARLGPGEFFGEAALITGEPRSATVVADEPTELFEIDQGALDAAMESAPTLQAALAQMATVRRERPKAEWFRNEAQSLIALSPALRRIRVGSDPTNDVQLDGPGVVPFHAEITRTAEGLVIRDLDPDTGDTYVNREPVRETLLHDGDLIRLGSRRLFLHDGVLKLFTSSLGVRVDAYGLGRTVAGGRKILEGVDLSLSPGEMVAIVGVSGAGKTTLLNLLVGLDTPSSGHVTYDGVRLDQHHAMFPGTLGFVPQEDIVHRSLTLKESLRYAGRLRLPRSVRGSRLRERINAAAESVGLSHRMDVAIGNLSGGERKRASVATELLSEPKAVFLDEPTSGLDPGLDEQLMHQFRALADEGRTVVLTTHATRNIRLCDRVVVIHGGRLVFAGPPADALRHFGVQDFAEIYHVLGRRAGAELEASYRESAQARRDGDSHARVGFAGHEPVSQAAWPVRRARLAVGAARQLPTLLSRDWKLVSRDRVGLLLRLLGPALLAGSLVMTFKRTTFGLKVADGGDYLQAITFLYLASAISLFLGAFTSSTAITSERAILKRERLVFLSPASYVLSKTVILALFALAQTLILTLTLAAGVRFPDPQTAVILRVFGALVLTSLAGTAMGLLVSSLSPNVDRAGILVVLLLIPQLIFSGSAIPRSRMQEPARVVSDLMVTKWSLELLGISTDLRSREQAQSWVTTQDPLSGMEAEFQVNTDKRPFKTTFWGRSAPRWAFLAGFSIVFTGATMSVLYLSDRRALRGRPTRRPGRAAQSPGHSAPS